MLEVLHQNYHMQGFTTDGEYMYWSFTDSLVKTNKNNTVISQVHIHSGHLGDIDYYNGSIYATLIGDSLAGNPWGVWTSFFVYVFDAETLALQKTIRLDPCYKMYDSPSVNGGFNGVDGIVVLDGEDGKPTMWLACALFSDEKYDKQMLLNFSLGGKLQGIKYFNTGNTTFGIQNLDYEADTGYFWISTYSAEKPYQAKETLYCLDAANESVVGAYSFYSPYGFHALGGGRYLASIQTGVNGNRQGYAYEASIEDIRRGLPTEADTVKLLNK